MTYKPLEISKMLADGIIDKLKFNELPLAERIWIYTNGLFMCGLQRLYDLTGIEKYLTYTKEWADDKIDDNGEFYFKDMVDACGFKYFRQQLDAIQPGLPYFKLYEVYGDEKYKNAIESVFQLLLTIPKTKEGAYWHVHSKPYQIWLDGLYMAEPFTMEYYRLTGKEECLDYVYKQIKLMTEHTLDKETGLLYHAWDESKEADWADKETGLASEIWGRALGWYTVALAEVLKLYPKERKEYNLIKEYFVNILTAVVKYQDESGLWYQVTNKPENEENWLETSCTCLFLYALAYGVRSGILDESFAENANRAFDGVMTMIKDTENGPVLTGVCVGTNVGDYENYIKAKTVDNDLHGTGAFLLAMAEYEMFLNRGR